MSRLRARAGRLWLRPSIGHGACAEPLPPVPCGEVLCISASPGQCPMCCVVRLPATCMHASACECINSEILLHLFHQRLAETPRSPHGVLRTCVDALDLAVADPHA